MLAILKILIIAYYNPPLGLLNVIVMSMILNVEILNKEDFDNLPNLVEKSKIMKYNKNFKEPKKLTTKKVIKKEKTDYEPDEKSEKEVKIKRKIGNVVSRELYNETMEEKEKMENSEKDVEEIDLDLDYDPADKMVIIVFYDEAKYNDYKKWQSQYNGEEADLVYNAVKQYTDGR